MRTEYFQIDDGANIKKIAKNISYKLRDINWLFVYDAEEGVDGYYISFSCNQYGLNGQIDIGDDYLNLHYSYNDDHEDQAKKMIKDMCNIIEENI